MPKVIIEPSLRMSCSLVELFETQVERIPERIALSCGAHRIPYDELNRQANRLARKLLAARVETGDIVGVCMDRSLGYI
ncbi:MAG TPA: AMP-binding protein, partial [Verrucomicrobiae bacterium]|nr:AMP-binding protein [Verrucomicrobiae bacterium]